MAGLLKDQLDTLYSSGMSLPEVATKLSCSVHKVTYWMTKHGIPRRDLSSAVYLKCNPDGDPFKLKTNLTTQDMLLFGLGIGIYWGEGNKASRNAIRVTNTDPKMIKSFRKFLLEICGLIPTKISYSLICFNDSDPTMVTNFWSNQLGVSKEKFGKIVQIRPQGKGSYKRKSQYGVCTLTVGNLKLKQWFLSQLENPSLPG